ncbi:unnamed protein product [Chrysoparadoxa australica]
MAELVQAQPATTATAVVGAGKEELLADGYPANLELPIRYIKGMGGDLVEARRRYIESLKWREEYKVDGLLSEAQPHFDAIKKYYPHFVYKRAKNGSLCYYEIPGQTNLPKLRENGVDLDALVRHYIYITEFIWRELDTGEEAKLLTMMDLKGVKVSQFVGEVKTFMVAAAKLIGAHYPERSFKIFILNAPWWFNMVWKVVSPVMHQNTRDKVTVCGSNYLKQLQELIDIENIPSAVGGKDTTPILESAEEVALREHTMKVLSDQGITPSPVV